MTHEGKCTIMQHLSINHYGGCLAPTCHPHKHAGAESVDVFEIQRRLVSDYKSYVESFVTIRDPYIRDLVKNQYSQDKYWPEALVQ